VLFRSGLLWRDHVDLQNGLSLAHLKLSPRRGSKEEAVARMSDLYGSYAELAACETEGVHYQIRMIERGSPIVVVAPHGGRIEGGTSQTAALIAGEDFSLYCFEGIAPGRRLHITSARFDEPRGVALVEASEIAVAVHGRADRGDPQTVWMGGLHHALRDAIGMSLERAGFRTSLDHHMQGKAPGNICNRGRMRAGVQLELPMSLRNSFVDDVSARQALVSALRATIMARTDLVLPTTSTVAITRASSGLRPRGDR
jgi:phage replication-related protein YjqB (UPF0714/DUF867 family)